VYLEEPIQIVSDTGNLGILFLHRVVELDPPLEQLVHLVDEDLVHEGLEEHDGLLRVRVAAPVRVAQGGGHGEEELKHEIQEGTRSRGPSSQERLELVRLVLEEGNGQRALVLVDVLAVGRVLFLQLDGRNAGR